MDTLSKARRDYAVASNPYGWKPGQEMSVEQQGELSRALEVYCLELSKAFPAKGLQSLHYTYVYRGGEWIQSIFGIY